jgi:hypothetical protein
LICGGEHYLLGENRNRELVIYRFDRWGLSGSTYLQRPTATLRHKIDRRWRTQASPTIGSWIPLYTCAARPGTTDLTYTKNHDHIFLGHETIPYLLGDIRNPDDEFRVPLLWTSTWSVATIVFEEMPA